jgi:sugar lactone lactonase YvrE
MTRALPEPGPVPARVLAAGLDHPEGVAWDPVSGRVLAGGESGQLYAVGLDGSGPDLLARTTGLILGVTADGLGRVAMCVSDEGEVRVWDGERVVTVLAEVDEIAMALPNYAAFGPDGTLYVSDSGAWNADRGRVVALAPDGTSWTLTRERERFTNGLAVSTDGRWLYVAESEGDEAGPRVSRLDLAAGDGRCETITALPGTVPDGVAVVADGSLLVTCYRPDRIVHVGLDGVPRVLCEDWQGTVLSGVTNVAFAGPDLDVLVCANLNRWHLSVVDAGLVGAPLHRPVRWAVHGLGATS